MDAIYRKKQSPKLKPQQDFINVTVVKIKVEIKAKGFT